MKSKLVASPVNILSITVIALSCYFYFENDATAK